MEEYLQDNVRDPKRVSGDQDRNTYVLLTRNYFPCVWHYVNNFILVSERERTSDVGYTATLEKYVEKIQNDSELSFATWLKGLPAKNVPANSVIRVLTESSHTIKRDLLNEYTLARSVITHVGIEHKNDPQRVIHRS